MEKVFILLEKSFFKENGTDYAMAVSERDIDLCSDFDKADTMRDGKIYNLEKMGFAQSEHIKNDACDYIVLKKDNYRVVLEIIMKTIA